MLDALRRGAKTWVAKALLLLLVASFGIWGIADFTQFSGARTVATVGDTPIEADDFQRAYQRQIQALSRQAGMPVTSEMAAQFGVPQQVLGGMISAAAVSDAAQTYGLGISDATLAKKIAEDPALRPEGAQSFDRTYFTRLLQQAGMTEQDYIDERRAEELRDQIEQGLAAGVTTPDALVQLLYRFQNEVRVVDHVSLQRAQVEPIPAPTDEQLTSWYDGQKSQFQAPELRTASIIAATPDALADPSTVSDEDARKEYERTRATYAVAEKRRIQQILLPDVDAATAARAKIDGGATFEQIAEERGVTPADLDLGLMAKSDMVDPAIADAAFALGTNEISQPIAARFGGALVRVTEIQPEQVQPYEAVAEQVKTSLARLTAERTVQDLYQEVEDARAGGATLKEIAERFDLDLKSVTVDAQGNGADGQPVSGLPEQATLIQDIFATEVGNENDPIVAGRGYVWYALDDVTPARDRPLDEVREQVVTAWTNEQAETLLDQKADELVKALQAGQDLATVAGPLGLTVTTTQPFARNGSVPALGDVGIDAAFAGPNGHATSLEGPDGGRIVLKVKSVVNPPFFAESADAQAAARQFRGELQATLIDEYTAAMQAKLGTSINQAMLEQVIGLGSR